MQNNIASQVAACIESLEKGRGESPKHVVEIAVCQLDEEVSIYGRERLPGLLLDIHDFEKPAKVHNDEEYQNCLRDFLASPASIVSSLQIARRTYGADAAPGLLVRHLEDVTGIPLSARAELAKEFREAVLFGPDREVALKILALTERNLLKVAEASGRGPLPEVFTQALGMLKDEPEVLRRVADAANTVMDNLDTGVEGVSLVELLTILEELEQGALGSQMADIEATANRCHAVALEAADQIETAVGEAQKSPRRWRCRLRQRGMKRRKWRNKRRVN